MTTKMLTLDFKQSEKQNFTVWLQEKKEADIKLHVPCISVLDNILRGKGTLAQSLTFITQAEEIF